MMVYPNAARMAIEEGLTEDDFFLDPNRRIFQAARNLYSTGHPIDLTTVSTRLQDMEILDKVGGIAYLTELTDAAVTSANTKSYVTLIKDKAVMRRMIETASAVVEEGYSGQEDVNEFLDRAEKEILKVTGRGTSFDFTPIGKLVIDVFEKVEKRSQEKRRPVLTKKP